MCETNWYSVQYGGAKHLLEFGLGRAEDTFVVLHLRPAVTLVVHLQAVVQQVQILLHLLGLVHGVRVQDLPGRDIINTSTSGKLGGGVGVGGVCDYGHGIKKMRVAPRRCALANHFRRLA